MIAVPVAVVVLPLFVALLFRVVCPPNEVHILQVGKKSNVYGSGQDLGNVYYEFPSWIPVIGVVVRKLPVSNFSIELNDYEAYDIGKVPFAVDVISFFRVEDPAEAAKRIQDFAELEAQLRDILRGAIRSILAGADIETIMAERTAFGEKFSTEVEPQLKAWGVAPVKSIELMDIRDSGDTEVITNIMQKKRSLIEKDSRIEVAENNKLASVAETEAQKEVDVKIQETESVVGQKTADKAKAIGIAEQKASQEIKAQEKVTAERDMEVNRVNEVKQAEINKEVQIVESQQAKEQLRIEAEGKQLETVTIAKGDKESQELRAEGLYAVGSKEAKVVAEKQIAEVAGDIELAEKISKEQPYMDYLQMIKSIGAGQAIGEAQALALADADLKLISTGNGKDGGEVNSLLGMLSAKGGVNLGAMMDTLKEVGGVDLSKVGGEARRVKTNKDGGDFRDEIVTN